MMAPEEIQQLKVQLDTKPYEKRLGKLSQSGNEYRAWCPWHEKNPAGHKSPSLAIYQTKDTGEWCFKCLTECGEKKGDVLKFVQEFDGVNFGVALRRVQNESGISSPTAQGTPAPTFQYDHQEALALLRQNPDVLDYLAGRGIDERTAVGAGLGLVDYPGIGPAIAIPYGDDTYKFRALKPVNKEKKFRHVAGRPTADLLYGIDQLNEFDTTVYVTESELDSLMLRARGFSCVSVSSATTSLDNGTLKINPEHLAKLRALDKVVLLLDQDKAGRLCAAAFAKEFPKWQLLDVEWELDSVAEVFRQPATEWTDPKTGEVVKVPAQVVDVRPPKDIGEVYENAPEDFTANLAVLEQEAKTKPPKWRQQFESIGEMDSRGLQWLIKGFMPEGTIALGALPGGYKTFFALSIAKALTTGKTFLDTFEVPANVPVLYLIPESSSAAFRVRAVKMGIPNDPKLFLCRTLSKGRTLLLDDPLLIEAVQEMGNPVVFLDTAVRFSQAESENDAIDNQQLVNDMVKLRQLGARAVVALHHSKKELVKFDMNLDNVLRGTGDLAAMCDAVYGIKRDDHVFDNGNGPSQMLVVCVKPRDFEPPKPFVIQATYREQGSGTLHSYLDQRNDFVVLAGATGLAAQGAQAAAASSKARQEKVNHLVALLQANPDWSNLKLATETGISRNDIVDKAAAQGWQRNDTGLWVKTGIFPTCGEPNTTKEPY